MIDINHVAKLARLGLTEKEKRKFKKELSAILDFVSQLDKAKTSKVKPTAQVTDLDNVVRQDKGREKSRQETDKLLNLAPETKDRYVKVKAIL